MVISRIFELCLLIQVGHSFHSSKHNSRVYHKTPNNVFSLSPEYPTSYGIYLAGETITIDIPTSLVNVSDTVNWKVVNLNSYRLMFVYKNKPKIMVDRKTIKDMKYSGKINGLIIPFGDNEALHVPTIFNPKLTKPKRRWNYIELLHFDDQSEKVSVIRSLPWLKDDDWKYIKEWKMTDYFHHENKLYLLIYRVIVEEKASKQISEASIIQLCLSKGSELISSAVEVHHTFTDYAFTDLRMDIVFNIDYSTLSNLDRSVHLLITKRKPGQNDEHETGLAENFLPLFDGIARKCASGQYQANDVTLLRYHLRSQVVKCKKSSYKSCSTKENIVPSTSFIMTITEHFAFPITMTGSIVNIETFSIPYPFYEKYTFFTSMFVAKFTSCHHEKCDDITVDLPDWNPEIQLHAYLNHKTSHLFYVTKASNTVFTFPLDPCKNLKSCIQCIMYGLYYDCVWSSSTCIHDYQTKKKTELTVNNCFKINQISPLTFNLSIPATLTIELDKALPKISNESLVILAGYNNCTNITLDGLYIYCSLSTLKSGKFPIDVSLTSDIHVYADTAKISAVSSDLVDIVVPELKVVNEGHTLTLMMVIILTLLLNLFLATACFVHKKKRLNKFFASKKAKKVRKLVSQRYRSFTLSSPSFTFDSATKVLPNMSSTSISKSRSKSKLKPSLRSK